MQFLNTIKDLCNWLIFLLPWSSFILLLPLQLAWLTGGSAGQWLGGSESGQTLSNVSHISVDVPLPPLVKLLLDQHAELLVHGVQG